VQPLLDSLRAAILYFAGMILVLSVLFGTITAASAAPKGDQRAYDSQLMRLSEILGAVHYLRELCQGKDGQRWRDAVNQLIKTEGNTALRRATIARRFNLGYRGYRRTYRKCTPSAKNTITRFFKEAIEVSTSLIKLGK
jgi:uncharacterized protein (TIGR02301 family)